MRGPWGEGWPGEVWQQEPGEDAPISSPHSEAVGVNVRCDCAPGTHRTKRQHSCHVTARRSQTEKHGDPSVHTGKGYEM